MTNEHLLRGVLAVAIAGSEMMMGSVARADGLPSALPACPTAAATFNDAIDTATANVGDVFTFTTVASADGSVGALPAGLKGYGLVTYARHARRDAGGELGIEARYVLNGDGTKASVSYIAMDAVSKGSNRNAPGIVGGALGAFRNRTLSVVSAAVGVYGFIHRGSEAAIAAGTPLQLIVGDGVEEGTCSVASRIAGDANYRKPL